MNVQFVMTNCYYHNIVRNARKKRPICRERRPWSSWSGPSLSAYIINWYCSICRRTQNVQIRLFGCTRSSGHSSFAYGIKDLFARCVSHKSDRALSVGSESIVKPNVTKNLMIIFRCPWRNTITEDSLPNTSRRKVNRPRRTTHVRSTVVITKSKGLSEIFRDIYISTYQICRYEEK